jgi:hypothetical protein
MKRLTPAVLLLMTTGCVFAVRPMNSIPPGDRVVLQLNDRGISDMAPTLGSGVYLVGGRLRQVDSTPIAVAIAAGVVATGVSTGLIIANWHHGLPPLPKLPNPGTGPNAGYTPANGP